MEQGGAGGRGGASCQPGAERPCARAVRLHAEAAGPTPGPRGRPEPAARAWRLHGECQVGPSDSSPPLRPASPGAAEPASWGLAGEGRSARGVPS